MAFKVGDRFKRYVVQTYTGYVEIKKILPSGRYRLSNGEMAGEFNGMIVSRSGQYHNPVRYAVAKAEGPEPTRS